MNGEVDTITEQGHWAKVSGEKGLDKAFPEVAGELVGQYAPLLYTRDRRLKHTSRPPRQSYTCTGGSRGGVLCLARVCFRTFSNRGGPRPPGAHLPPFASTERSGGGTGPGRTHCAALEPRVKHKP